jgi:hypothetical protein
VVLALIVSAGWAFTNQQVLVGGAERAGSHWMGWVGRCGRGRREGDRGERRDGHHGGSGQDTLEASQFTFLSK